MTTAQQAQQRVGGFEKLYKAFYEFYVKELARDDSPFSKYKLELSTVFFEIYDEQTKVTYPLFKEVVATYDEKKAVARAALHDALVVHTFGTYLASRDSMLQSVVNAHEDQIQALKKLLGKEKTSAIPQGK